MSAVAYVRIGCTALAALAAVGALAAARELHERYLASRLFGLCGAALFGVLAAPRIVEVAQSRPRMTVALGVVIGLIFLAALALFLDPDRIFRFLAWLAGNPHARTPF
jgi:hypothetical protein